MARLSVLDGYVLPASEGETSFGAWLKISRDGEVEVVVPHQEIGQGIYALAALLAAEGLRLPPEAVRAVQAPIHARFANPLILLDGLPNDEHEPGAAQQAVVWTFDRILRVGFQATGGSTSTRNIAEPIMTSAASPRSADARGRRAVRRRFRGFAGRQRQDRRARRQERRLYGELAEAAARLRPRPLAPRSPRPAP